MNFSGPKIHYSEEEKKKGFPTLLRKILRMTSMMVFFQIGLGNILIPQNKVTTIFSSKIIRNGNFSKIG